jgi:hypothetical protein
MLWVRLLAHVTGTKSAIPRSHFASRLAKLANSTVLRIL